MKCMRTLTRQSVAFYPCYASNSSLCSIWLRLISALSLNRLYLTDFRNQVTGPSTRRVTSISSKSRAHIFLDCSEGWTCPSTDLSRIQSLVLRGHFLIWSFSCWSVEQVVLWYSPRSECYSYTVGIDHLGMFRNLLGLPWHEHRRRRQFGETRGSRECPTGACCYVWLSFQRASAVVLACAGNSCQLGIVSGEDAGSSVWT